jgi:hypothetical protein
VLDEDITSRAHTAAAKTDKCMHTLCDSSDQIALPSGAHRTLKEPCGVGSLFISRSAAALISCPSALQYLKSDRSF